MVTLSRDIILPRGTHSATCHTKDLTCDNFLFLKKKNLKI